MRAVLGTAAVGLATIALGATGIQPASAVTKLTQSQAESALRAGGVTWSSSGGCTDRGNPKCTSFEQINKTSVDGVLVLKRASGCAINVTGGTENGHAGGTYSHANGYKVDLTKGDCVGTYIKNTFTYVGKRGDGYPQWKAPSGNLYCDEGNHWDITYFTSGD